MANINKIRVSGTTYNIEDTNATKTAEVSQAQYDALVAAGTVDSNTFYIITDAEYFDPSNYYTSAQTQSAITQSVSGKADTSAVTSVSDSLTAHTANTTVHVTASEKSTWNSKSDFSGDYNDLTNKPTIPTVPTSNTAFTNDAGYITSSALDGYATTGDVQTATNDMATKTWVGQQGYLTQHQDISGKQDVSGMTAYTTTATTSALNNVVTAHTANTSIHVSAEQIAAWNAKSDFSGSYNDLTNKLSAGTNITIVDNVISAEGGGKAVAAGTNISVTTGETADTINCTIPAFFHRDTVKGDINIGLNSGVDSNYGRLVIGRRVKSRGNPYFEYSIGIGVPPSTNSSDYNELYGSQSIGIGGFKIGNGSQYANFVSGCVAIGYGAKTRINNAVAIGRDTEASGTTQTNINNQLKIDTSNQVYIYNKDNTEMICLQDQLGGGGGSSYTAGDGIDITNDVISVTGKVDTTAFTAHTADTTMHVTSSDKSSWNGAATNASNAVTALGGLSLVKLTQAQYDALTTKDNSTLYVIVN